MANKFGKALMESGVLSQSDERVEQALNGNPDNQVASHDADFNANIERLEREQKAQEQTASPVVQTTVVQSSVTLGVNVQLPEEYHLRLTMYNKRNHLGGIKNVATRVVMEWIDAHCPR